MLTTKARKLCVCELYRLRGLIFNVTFILKNIFHIIVYIFETDIRLDNRFYLI